MTEREQFEAWAAREYGNDDDDSGVSLERQGDGYRYSSVDDAWNGWKASRRAALEEACGVIMQPANMSYFWGEAKGADHCAEEIAKQIRALSRGSEA